MAKINFGGVWEDVVTCEEFTLSRAQEVLKGDTVAVLGYGVQGPGQSLNLRDNGIRVIVGQREGGASWEKAVKDGFVPGKTLFSPEEAAKRGTIVQYLLQLANFLRCSKPQIRHMPFERWVSPITYYCIDWHFTFP